jgi:8-oxo-dGTP pyrophosphatase MutT (NUDIX family)
MLLRDAPAGQGLEVFMVRRVIQSDFMPDVYVFPGGSVQQDDREAEQTPGICQEVTLGPADPEGRTAPGTGIRPAAIRELFEEAGILPAYYHDRMLTINDENRVRFAAWRQAFQERKGSLITLAQEEELLLTTGNLRYFSHWITPEGLPKRFDTHFFLLTAPDGQQPAYDQLETSEGLWISPALALERWQNGTFPLVFATIYQLRELATFPAVAAALQAAQTTHVQTHAPVMVEHAGQVHIHLPDDQSEQWMIPEHLRMPPPARS